MNNPEPSSLDSCRAIASAQRPAPAESAPLVTVLCPKGFTLDARDNPDAHRMLFVRVTYRPA